MYAMALQALRRKTTLLQSILRYDPYNRGEQDIASFQGDTVVVPLPAEFSDSTVSDVVPANTPPAPNNITPNYATVTLDNWKKVDFHFTDREISNLQQGIFSDQFDAAIDALARTVVRSVWANFTGVYQFAGTAGLTPFQSNTGVVQEARKLLNLSGVPMPGRSIILGFDADANAIGLNVFQQYLQKGNTETLEEGIIRRALGFDWNIDGYLPNFTGGTLSNGTSKAALVNGAVSVGAATMNIDSTTLTGTLVKGDLFTVAGSTQQYVVTGNSRGRGHGVTQTIFCIC
jgi:P22 coat protein - gene protein 5